MFDQHIKAFNLTKLNNFYTKIMLSSPFEEIERQCKEGFDKVPPLKDLQLRLRHYAAAI
jgi:hypothetical protein